MPKKNALGISKLRLIPPTFQEVLSKWHKGGEKHTTQNKNSGVMINLKTTTLFRKKGKKVKREHGSCASLEGKKKKRLEKVVKKSSPK